MTNLKQQELLKDVEQTFETLFTLIQSLPPKIRNFSVETEERDKNFRDVLMHLYEWHAMLERWYREGMDGDTPEMPAPGYKWRNLDKLNMQTWQQYQHIKLSQAMKKLRLSHNRITQLIKIHNDEEIFTEKYYKWTKTSNLYSYFAANTVDHYKWALRKCKKIVATIEMKKYAGQK